MKIFLILLLLSSNVFAQKIKVSGYGNTNAEAIADAKKKAVDMVSGYFIMYEEEITNGEYNQEIKAFTTGIVNNYKILLDHGNYVELEVEVVIPKYGRIESKSQNINIPLDKVSQLEMNYNDKEKIRRLLDNTNKAFVFVIDSVSYEHDHMNIEGTLKYREKWKSDYKAFKKVSEDLNFKNVVGCRNLGIMPLKIDKNGEVLELSYNPSAIELESTTHQFSLRGKPRFKFEMEFWLKVPYQGFKEQIDHLEMSISCFK